MQSDLFAPSPAAAPPKQSKGGKRRAVTHEATAAGDGRPNLGTLDVRIYGVKCPIDLKDCDQRFDGMTPEQVATYRLKYMPLKFVYSDEDFTDLGKVKLLRQRGWRFWDIAEQFPDLADAAVQMAIDQKHAIA